MSRSSRCAPPCRNTSLKMRHIAAEGWNVCRLSERLEEARGSEKHLHHGTKGNRDKQESTDVRRDERHAHLHEALIDAPASNVATRIAGRCERDHTPSCIW